MFGRAKKKTKNEHLTGAAAAIVNAAIGAVEVRWGGGAAARRHHSL